MCFCPITSGQELIPDLNQQSLNLWNLRTQNAPVYHSHNHLNPLHPTPLLRYGRSPRREGDPRFETLFPVWTNPLVFSVYSERSCCLRRSSESRDFRSSPSTGCHGHRQGCIAPATCPHKPEAELGKLDVRICRRNLKWAISLRRHAGCVVKWCDCTSERFVTQPTLNLVL